MPPYTLLYSILCLCCRCQRKRTQLHSWNMPLQRALPGFFCPPPPPPPVIASKMHPFPAFNAGSPVCISDHHHYSGWMARFKFFKNIGWSISKYHFHSFGFQRKKTETLCEFSDLEIWEFGVDLLHLPNVGRNLHGDTGIQRITENFTVCTLWTMWRVIYCC